MSFETPPISSSSVEAEKEPIPVSEPGEYSAQQLADGWGKLEASPERSVAASEKEISFELNGASISAENFTTHPVPERKVSFMLNGVSVPAENFTTHPAEAAKAIAEAKEQQEILDGFYARIREALGNVESVISAESEGAAIEAPSVLAVKQELSKVDDDGAFEASSVSAVKRKFPEVDDDGAFLLKIADMAKRFPGGEKALAGLALVIGLSSLPKNAEALSINPVTVVEKEVERGVNDGVRGASRDTGRAVGGVIEGAVDAIRKSIGLETPQERAQREAKEKSATRQLEQEHARELQKFKQEQNQRVREDTRRVTDFERTTDQYKRKLEDVRRSFNQEFDRAQATYTQQRERANTPEQAKRYEREQWQRWLQASRSALQRLEQYDNEIDNTTPDASDGVVASLAQRVAGAKMERSDLLQSSVEMRQALSELAAKMEQNLGITENAQSPLRKLEEKKVSPSSQSVGQSSEKKSSSDSGIDTVDPKYRF